jgi:hypothetical protein
MILPVYKRLTILPWLKTKLELSLALLSLGTLLKDKALVADWSPNAVSKSSHSSREVSLEREIVFTATLLRRDR